MRLEPDPYPLAPGDLRDLAIDVLNWLGWESQDLSDSTSMRLTPPGAAPIILELTNAMDDAVLPADRHPASSSAASSGPPPSVPPGSGRPDVDLRGLGPEPGRRLTSKTRITVECPDAQEALARILLDEIHGAIQRRTEQGRTEQGRTDPEGTTT
ncbi:MAG: hypothetical protein LBK95_07435 [Bifidobacteriaceae bacterium]|nr:hypothetical protein [Bifidobacteriaceae bacterium]